FGYVAKAKTLKFAIISDQNTLWESFMNGEIDAMCTSIPASHANDLDGNENYNFYTELGINRTYLTFNLEDEIFSKREVREAIALAVDRQGCWDRTGGGSGVPAEYMISPVFSNYVKDEYKLP